MNVQSMMLDVSKQPQISPVLYLGQGDKNGTTLEAAIYDGGIPLSLSGKGAVFALKSPNGQAYYEVSGTVSGNVATFAIDETYAASISGKSEVAYVEITEGDTVIASTNRFTVIVLESAEEGADPSQAYSSGIVEATERALAAAEAAEGVVMDDIPTMSANIKGGAKLGDGLEITDGVLSVVRGGTVEVPTMTETMKGGAKLGSGLEVDSNEKLNVKVDGTTISVDSNGALHGASTYELPTMSANVKGGAKVGTALEVDANGALGVKPGTTQAIGGVKPDGTTITVDSDGTIHGANSYELPTMSKTVKGGATLGSGLTVDDGALSLGDLVQSGSGAEVATDGCAIYSVSGEGWATQDGTPTPDNPVEIEVARGHEIAGQTGRYVDLIVKDANDVVLSTTPIPLPAKGFAASLPDGTADALTVDSAGRWEWVNESDECIVDGASINASFVTAPQGSSVGYRYGIFIPTSAKVAIESNFFSNSMHYSSRAIASVSTASWQPGDAALYLYTNKQSLLAVFPEGITTVADANTWLASNPMTLLYPLATPTTEHGYIDLPALPSGATVSCPELEQIGVSWFVDGAKELVEHAENIKPATESRIGGVKPDGTTITVAQDGTISGANSYTLPPATTSTLGGVIPDGTTITVDSNGTIHGGASGQVSPISNATIDAVVSDQSPTGTDSLQTTGLSYLWTKLKAAFASITHTHTVLGDSSTKTVTVNANGVAECSGTATGSNSHAEGGGTTAAGEASHAEGAGAQTTSSARAAHAEGSQTAASAAAAHAEGVGSTASGAAAHAEGQQAQARGAASHAEGTGTIAGSASQHVSGKYNVTDSSDVYAEIVGNGTSETSSNARTLDWDGNAWHAGDVVATDGSNNQVSLVDLKAAVGTVDVQTDGSLQEQINDLGESVSSRLPLHHVKTNNSNTRPTSTANMANLKPYIPTESCAVVLDAYGAVFMLLVLYANENYMGVLVIHYAGMYKWMYNNGTWSGGAI